VIRLAASFLCALALAACAIPRETVPAAQGAAGWRGIATEHDRERMRGWRNTWLEALRSAREGGHGSEIAGLGPLAEPDSALLQPLPPAGDYACRTIKLGSQSKDGLDYVAYPAFRCRIAVENGLVRFTKLSGSQRPIGVILPDSERRHIFLGTLQLGDEIGALQYGRDRERDMVAAVERVGDARWRLAFPAPHFESMLDLIELVPTR
jgi:hypothetical protein